MYSIVSLPNSRSLSLKIAQQLHVSEFSFDTERFPDGELKVQGEIPIDSGTCFLVQSFVPRISEALIETLLAIDVLRRSGIKKIVLVAPFLPYCRHQNAALALGATFVQAGVSSVIACHIHDQELLKLYPCPLIQLEAVEILVAAICKDMAESSREKLVVVAPDKGAFLLAQKYAEKFGVPFASIQKRRLSAEQVEVISLTGDVQGKLVLLADDMCSTAGTLASAAKACREKGAKEVHAAVTHALLVGNAAEVLKDAGIKSLWTTDTCVAQSDQIPDLKFCVSSLSSLLASCIPSLA